MGVSRCGWPATKGDSPVGGGDASASRTAAAGALAVAPPPEHEGGAAVVAAAAALSPARPWVEPLSLPPIAPVLLEPEPLLLAPQFTGLGAFSLRTAEDDEADFGPCLRAMLANRCVDWHSLPRESDHGCVEYKWRLGSEHGGRCRHRRVDRLATQMQFRLGEGGGTAFYLLGVRDSGAALGLLPKELSDSARILMDAAAAAAAGGARLLLEAMSDASKDGRRCSAWRVSEKHSSLQQVSWWLSAPPPGGAGAGATCAVEGEGTSNSAPWRGRVAAADSISSGPAAGGCVGATRRVRSAGW